MNDPILGARPGGLNGGYSPFDLDFEKQRTQQMLDDARRRNQALSDLARRQQELNDIRRQADEANRKYNSAYDGYNGILANIYGPGGGNGNPGMYQGPGGGRGCGGAGMPPCGGGGGGMYPGGGCGGGMPCGGGGGPVAGCGSGSSCGGCTSMLCYPGVNSAYYSPPYATGNYGYGGGIYPQRSNGFFVNFKYNQFSQVPKAKDTLNAR
jgi:hypothetical protein